jgi:5-methylcytosine-specific restriction protein A
MNLYPVKTIIALATGYPTTGFHGGTEANQYIVDKGFTVIHLRAFSWKIVSESVATKRLDKSAFLHRGTGVPIEIRPFFLPNEIHKGQKLPIALVHDEKNYSAHIIRDNQDTARTRLFWSADFAILLRETFPYYFQKYASDEQPDSELFLKFERVSGFNIYRVSFTGQVSEERIVEDLRAEELEDNGPQSEGGAKEYYGTRYERSPRNRQRAITLHGLTCNICGFNFEKAYGPRGEDFIEVHHVKPISTLKEKQPIDPQNDLITVCSNCHRMIHRKPDEVLTVRDMTAVVAAYSGKRRIEKK